MSARKENRYALVYQAGIANVFAVDNVTSTTTARNAVRLYQGDYNSTEMMVRGLRLAGGVVGVFSANKAGDIAERAWDTKEDDSPWRENMRYASCIGGVL